MLLRTLAGQGTAYGLQHLFVDLHQSATTAPIQIADYGQVLRPMADDGPYRHSFLTKPPSAAPTTLPTTGKNEPTTMPAPIL
jgi:hypothetical protein